jgi:hypothetical protein
VQELFQSHLGAAFVGEFCDALAAMGAGQAAARMPMAVVALLLAVAEAATRVERSKGQLLMDVVVDQLARNHAPLCRGSRDASFVTAGAPRGVRHHRHPRPTSCLERLACRVGAHCCECWSKPHCCTH